MMRRVSSRQRLVSWDAFDATASETDSDASSRFVVEEESGDHLLKRKRVPKTLASAAAAESPKMAGGTMTESLSSSVIEAYDWELAATAKSPMPPKTSLLSLLNDDVQLQILEFCDLKSLRSVMQVNHRYRNLIASSQPLWIGQCCQRWTWLSNKLKNQQNDTAVDFQDDLHLPTPVSVCSNDLMSSSGANLPNMSFLLSLAAPYASSTVDETLFTRYRWNRPLRRGPFRNTALPVSDEVELRAIVLPNGTTAIQFIGTVGQGDRCLRADQPLPRPTAVLQKHSSKTFPRCLLQRLSHSSSSASSVHADWIHQQRRLDAAAATAAASPLLEFLTEAHELQAKQKNAASWKPFVVPYMCRATTSANNAMQVNLTPRLVAYFEVSILDTVLVPPQQIRQPTYEERVHQDPLQRHRRMMPHYHHASECIAVGIALKEFSMHTRMPGWDPISFGYHGDDGGIFHGAGHMVRPYGPRFGAGDTIGCGIDYATRAIFFTKNGQCLGNAFENLFFLDPTAAVTTTTTSSRSSSHISSSSLRQQATDMALAQEWYPVVGLDSNHPVVCNFGQTPFLFDLDAYQKQQRNHCTRKESSSSSSSNSL